MSEALTAEDLDRVARHLPCLEKAAADESADPRVRAAVAAELVAARAVLGLLGGLADAR